MKKKAAVLCGAILLALIVGLTFLLHQRSGVGYDAFVTVACEGQTYEEQHGVGYLSFTTSASGHAVTKRIQVRDADIMQSLSAIDAGEVIGVNLSVSLPARYVAEHHLDVKTVNAFQLLADAAYDDYFSIIGFSVFPN